jgi:hypothetical protein
MRQATSLVGVRAAWIRLLGDCEANQGAQNQKFHFSSFFVFVSRENSYNQLSAARGLTVIY